MFNAFQTPITSNVLPLRRKQTLYVATSYVCDRETRELGEDYAELRGIEVAYRLLMARLNRARRRCNSDDGRSSIKEMLMLIPDARHDASFGSTLSLAKDAARDAAVVRMVRRVVSHA